MALRTRLSVLWQGKALKDLSAKYDDKALKDITHEVALEVERRAKLLAPVDTGRLRASIEAGADDEGAFVKAGTEYAAYMEFGTGQAGSSTDPGPTPDWYQHGPSPGVPAQPFLRPAVESMRGQVADIVKRST